MGAKRDRELFPRDPMLMARMVLAAVLTPLVVIALLAVVFAEAPAKVIVFACIAAAVGTVMMIKERANRPFAREVDAVDAPELHAHVERLCLMADLPKPAIVIEPAQHPNSWIVGTGRRGYRLHLTRGLLNTLEASELEAVIGHELAHVAHRDAAVMTVVGGPPSVLLGGGARMMRGGSPIFMLGAGVALGIGWAGSLGTRALSRYREFAADAGSVALTGNPAALASALTKVSEGLVTIPQRDLRSAIAQDAFHLLPVARRGRGNFGLPATHPPLAARIARLQRMEQRLQDARRF
jgi:heat shock protein HtpX